MDYYIYKIYCSDPLVKHLYIGSTTDFERRVRDHKNCSSFTNISINKIKKLYSIIRAYGGWEHWKMEIIETIPCTDRQTAEEREQYYYETLNASLNNEPPIKDKTKENFRCDQCNFVSYEKENLENHKKNCWCYDEFKTTHPTLMLEECIKAQQREILELKLSKKIVEQPNDDKRCSKCGKIFTRNSNLLRHLKTCNGLDPLQCPKCKNFFSCAAAKSRHIKNVTCQLVLTEDQQRIKELEEQLEESELWTEYIRHRIYD